MSEIKPGTIAYLKATDEPCFVLAIQQVPDSNFTFRGLLGGVTAKVRRPNISDKGSITHGIEDFFLEELETKSDASLRKLNEINELQSTIKAQQSIPNQQMQLPDFKN